MGVPYISGRSKRRILLFLDAVACAALLNLLTQRLLPIRHTTSLLYGALLISCA